ncbi:MAG: 16S rRNA (cytosine(1402)-N(4))-methyltransferase RsmH [Magnetococcales bacterium]|nr:16S rRNA (cytosine(1402)-N(4))-methyltransferase RsmH [Magnetococcales bacterium]
MQGSACLRGPGNNDPGDHAGQNGHISVLPQETLAALEPVAGGVYVDATFGDGGHTRALLNASAPDGRVIALDRDPEAISRGEALARDFGERLTLIHSPFGQLGRLLEERGLDGRVDGILFDVGVSSRQLDTPGRGFSFRLDGPLDMRMDTSSDTPTAADLLNRMSAEALADLFFHLGEERHSRKAARAIVAQRTATPFATTRQLATLLERVLPFAGRIHPATRIFQALRIAVNRELEELSSALTAAMAALAPQGRVAVISFHSLEDRIVKQTFRAAALPPPTPTGPAALLMPFGPVFVPGFRLPFNRPLTPGDAETATNPRARSARLRVIQKLPPASPRTGEGSRP